MNQLQIRQLANLTADIGIVCLASVALPALLQKFDMSLILVGSITSVSFWIMSILMLKGGSKNE